MLGVGDIHPELKHQLSDCIWQFEYIRAHLQKHLEKRPSTVTLVRLEEAIPQLGSKESRLSFPTNLALILERCRE